MTDARLRECSSAAKLAHVVLDNCGPLAPSEVAEEAYITPAEAREGLTQLAECGFADPVCGVCEEREVVYALVESSHANEPSP